MFKDSGEKMVEKENLNVKRKQKIKVSKSVCSLIL
jgi:hypothetical protein